MRSTNWRWFVVGALLGLAWMASRVPVPPPDPRAFTPPNGPTPSA